MVMIVEDDEKVGTEIREKDDDDEILTDRYYEKNDKLLSFSC